MITLIPVRHVVPVPGQPGEWESLGNDPHFALDVEGLLGTSWLLFRCTGGSDIPRSLKLYIGTNEGFSERLTILLGHLLDERRQLSQYIHLPPGTRTLRLDVGESVGRFHLQVLSLRAVHARRVNFAVLGGLCYSHRAHLRHVPEAMRRAMRHGPRIAWRELRSRMLQIPEMALPTDVPYRPESHTVIMERADAMRAELATWQAPPTISLLVPVYNPDRAHLQACIDSVVNQVYPHWQLCLADDKSTAPGIVDLLKAAATRDPRIVVTYRQENGHICKATNSALESATGAYIGLLDNDDLLSPHALFTMAKAIVANPQLDFLYSDEDKINDAGKRFEPFFKPDWFPDLLCGFMYTCHLSVYRAGLVRAVGGFRPGFEGSQDHDLCLRITERTSQIQHIPEVLYHWRVHQGSTALTASVKSYAIRAGLKAVQEALDRRGEGGLVTALEQHTGKYYVRYPVRGNPLVSILIPTRDGAELLGNCLQSLFDKTTYQNFEVIILDNGSRQPETFALFERFRAQHPQRFRVDRHDIPFNFSRLNNLGAAAARGELVLMLNNDTTIISPTWLEEMVGWAQRPSVGVVGAMLLYPDETIQHAGVILGLGGVAGHSHKYFPATSPGYFGRLVIPSPYLAVTAACLLVRKSVFDQVGGLDENLQVAFNDVDFCCKVSELGLVAIVPPGVRLFHYESKSRGAEDTPAKQERFRQEINRMKERWGVKLSNDPSYSPRLTNAHENFGLAENH